MKPSILIAFLLAVVAIPEVGAQVEAQHHPAHTTVALQPLAQQVRRLEDALRYLGQPLNPADHGAINAAIAGKDEAAAVEQLQQILDRHVLVVVEINPESRVKVAQGAAAAELLEGGTRLFLVKVINQAGVTAPLAVESPNSGPVSIPSRGSPEPQTRLTQADVAERWADISLYQREPLRPRLSGLGIDYQILQVYSRDRGQRAALLRFNVGQGSQDIGFRNEVSILFQSVQAHAVTLRVRDEKGQPSTAGFLVRDRLQRIYPNPSKRLAPDLPFQPQVYRRDGETLGLPPGTYTIECSRGPEYLPERREVTITGPAEVAFELKRWIDPSRLGWYSGDHHIHSAGCSHYENPTQGVQPEDMWRQLQGEALNIGSVLTWGPCYYYQKQFFSGQDHPLSTSEQLLHFDLEVSGFPSSHAGHLILLGLKEQDFPGTRRIEDWPTWDLPVLRWGKAQGAVVGFAHSGWGLEARSFELPNYDIPSFDGIGANEYIVDVTHDSVDFISAADTPAHWELNIWYHTLNVGFRTRISGETDFPCITDDFVGQGRSYAKLDGPLNYRRWIDAVRDGRCYVSDGKSHLIDFKVRGVEVGTAGSEVKLDRPATVRVEAQVAALLDSHPDPQIRALALDQKPYWAIERARIGATREVPVELVVNGQVAARKNIVADGVIRPIEFDVAVERSSWIALRILPSSHTNPAFVMVAGKPIRASRRSAEWCLAAVDQCWTQKSARIGPADREAARAAYEHAREIYRKRIEESR
ncbi:MAG: CehA/McbA family metallohydrolase [Acidobacteriota bacterium]